MGAIYQTMQALHDIGAIGKQIMRGFDEACLTVTRDTSRTEVKTLQPISRNICTPEPESSPAIPGKQVDALD
jgi:hypothetical protein